MNIKLSKLSHTIESKHFKLDIDWEGKESSLYLYSKFFVGGMFLHNDIDDLIELLEYAKIFMDKHK